MPHNLQDLLAEQQRLSDMLSWTQSEEIERAFRSGYSAACDGIGEDEAWSKSAVKARRDAMRKALVKPIDDIT